MQCTFVPDHSTFSKQMHYTLVLNKPWRYKKFLIRTNAISCDFLLPPQ
jgi:hypothetical protein